MRARAINDQKEIFDVISRSQWCHVAMIDPDGKPYVIPMNFGFRDNVIYIHGAQHGKKTGCLMQYPEVCINFTTDQQLRYQSEQVACSWSMKYRSVLCYGVAEFITDPVEKMSALNVIMAQYTSHEFKYNPPSIREVSVIKINVSRYEGRAYGY